MEINSKYGARRFNSDSYKKYDQYAKELFATFLLKKGHVITKSEEDYKHDLRTTKDGKDYLFELEVKVGYPFTDDSSFKFNSVSFLGRKYKLHKQEPFYYVIVCYETGYALFCHSNDIYKQSYIEKSNVNTDSRKGSDLFYRVPKNKCKFFSLNDK